MSQRSVINGLAGKLRKEELEIIRQLAASGAEDFLRAHGTAFGTKQQVEDHLKQYALRKAPPLIAAIEAIEERAAFDKLLNYGCKSTVLIPKLLATVDIPRALFPSWENLTGIRRQRLSFFLNGLQDIATMIQRFVSVGGLELVPDDNGLNLTDLPDLLVRFARVLTYTHALTDKRRTQGPDGIHSMALSSLAQYIKSSTGKWRTAEVIDLLSAIGKNVDERVYRRFVRRIEI